MSKRFLALLIAVLGLLLAGCGKQSTVSSISNKEETIFEEPESIIETIIETEDETGISTESPDEDISILKEDKTDYTYGVYLLRDDSIYSLKEFVLTGKNESYSVYQRDDSADGGYYVFNCSEVGNFPVPVYQGGDKVILYPTNASSATAKLELSRVEYKEYSVAVKKDNLGNVYVNNFTTPVVFHTKADVYIESADGTELDNWHELEYGEIVKVYWYEGAEYNERELKAVLKSYQIVDSTSNNSQGVSLTIEGEKTKNGYIEFDVSNVPAGIYMTGEHGLIEFK